MTRHKTLSAGIGGIGLTVFAIGCVLGLFVVPPEKHMGDVGRVLYVHVPTAWNCLLFLSFGLWYAVRNLWTSNPESDAMMTASLEVGTLLGGMLLVQGSIWAKPTWGVYWTWDPRLTTTAIMFVLFCGVLALRAFIEDSSQRASWSAVATILAWVSVPIVYMSVRWWRTLHQPQSSPDTVDDPMVMVMRMNAVAVLLFGLWFTERRARIERNRRNKQDLPMPERLSESGA